MSNIKAQMNQQQLDRKGLTHGNISTFTTGFKRTQQRPKVVIVPTLSKTSKHNKAFTTRLEDLYL